ncbi:YcaO-like family protein [Streptomyces graminilatus]|uniref:YcaO-like family protein n=1 Tax=Streptomyces graminilatus TaxID=1464070 RepID=UPI0006E21E6F|nr:YcaO-like family protein [Streptomyces graminilatus]
MSTTEAGRRGAVPAGTGSFAESVLLDARTGLVTRLERQRRRPGLPRMWVGYGASVARTDVFAPWLADRFGFGASAGDEERARRAAVGEAVERYCGNAVPSGLRTASYRELTALGLRALDPETLALYSPAQHATPGFPFTPFTRELPVAWTPGRDLHDGAEVFVPASLVWLDYFHGPRAAEPATHSLVYSGIAAGENRAHAERFAIEELLERDATTLWWSAGAEGAAIVDADAVVGRLGGPAPGEGPGPTVRLLHIPSEFGVPVAAAFLEDRERDMVAFGSACRADPQLAAEKALVEAYGLYSLTRQLAEPDSEVWQAVAAGTLEGHVFRPFRADRTYRDAFRADYRDLTDLPAIAQLYLDPRMQGGPLDRLRGPARVAFRDIPAVPDAEARDVYLRRLADAGLHAYSVDLTTPDVAAAGLSVVRVVVPGLVGNAPPAFPCLGGVRLYRTPARLGFVQGPLREDELYPHPLPLA